MENPPLYRRGLLLDWTDRKKRLREEIAGFQLSRGNSMSWSIRSRCSSTASLSPSVLSRQHLMAHSDQTLLEPSKNIVVVIDNENTCLH